MKQEQAEMLAIQALGWLCADEERIMPFLAQTGADIHDLKNRAAEPEFLAFVMEFILSDDAMVIDCADALSLNAENMINVRAALPGGQLPHWT